MIDTQIRDFHELEVEIKLALSEDKYRKLETAQLALANISEMVVSYKGSKLEHEALLTIGSLATKALIRLA